MRYSCFHRRDSCLFNGDRISFIPFERAVVQRSDRSVDRQVCVWNNNNTKGVGLYQITLVDSSAQPVADKEGLGVWYMLSGNTFDYSIGPGIMATTVAGRPALQSSHTWAEIRRFTKSYSHIGTVRRLILQFWWWINNLTILFSAVVTWKCDFLPSR